LSDGVNDLQIL